MRPKEGRRRLCGPAAGSEPLVEVINLCNGPIRPRRRGLITARCVASRVRPPLGLIAAFMSQGRRTELVDRLEHIDPEARVDVLRAAFQVISCTPALEV